MIFNLLKRFIFPPNIDSIHQWNILGPEEELELMMKNFMDPLAACIRYEGTEYIDHVVNCNAVPYYDDMKRWLQLLSYNNPVPEGGRWVCKSPFDSMYIDAFMTTFPDANFVWTHRNLDSVIASFCSLCVGFSSLFRGQLNKEKLGENSMKLVALLILRCLRTRNNLLPEQQKKFYDCEYKNILKDPIGEVRKIYSYFGYEFSLEFENNMKRWLIENPQGKHGKHTYSLEEFGLDASIVRAHLSEYIDQYRDYF